MTGIFLAVSKLGIMTTPPLIGQFLETFGPITVPAVVGVAMLTATIVFVIMLSLARRRPTSAQT